MGYIDAKVTPSDFAPMWRFIGFYGNPNAEAKNHSWTLIIIFNFARDLQRLQ